VPDVRLIVAGSIQNRGWYNRLYHRICRRLASVPGLAARVEWREGFVPPDEVAGLFGAVDLVLLPHAQCYGSASGVVHRALGAGRLVLCSRSAKFAEIGQHVSPDLTVATLDARAWAARIEQLLRDEAERHALSIRVRTYADQTAWPRVAAQHLLLYERLRSARAAAGAARRAPRLAIDELDTPRA
jgi:glycosyltransferase involved in cell wall biosynthesis